MTGLADHPKSPLAMIASGQILARVPGGVFGASYKPAEWSLDHIGLQVIFPGQRRGSVTIKRTIIHAYMAFSSLRPSRGGLVTTRFVENPKSELPSIAAVRFSSKRTIRPLFDFIGEEAALLRLVSSVEALVRRKMVER